jgi:hypothetical protein
MRKLVLYENGAYYAYIIMDRKPNLVGIYETLAAAKTAASEVLWAQDPVHCEEEVQRIVERWDKGLPPPRNPKKRWRVRGVRNFKMIPGGKLGA